MNKKGFTTQQPCHPEFISGSCSKIADQARNDKKIKGFTLIELLVVVLIIAVLAMIALPKYKLTVENARVTEAYTLLKAITDAAERYKLATGDYPLTNYWSQLDIEFQDTTEGGYVNTETFKYLLSGSGGRALAYRQNPSSTYFL